MMLGAADREEILLRLGFHTKLTAKCGGLIVRRGPVTGRKPSGVARHHSQRQSFQGDHSVQGSVAEHSNERQKSPWFPKGFLDGL